jgi:putative ABC transport system permease protein
VLLLVWRKIISNTWKVLCLLLGSILVVGMVCSIPIYTRGILQRMLIKDLENEQANKGVFPGYLILDSEFSYIDDSEVASTEGMLRQKLDSLSADMPVSESLRGEIEKITNLFYMADINGQAKSFGISLGSMTGFPEHIKLAKGRIYQPQLADGILEVIASAAALKYSGMVMDHVYEVYSYRQTDGEPPLIKVKIVGLYEAANNQDIYWCKNTDYFSSTLIAEPQLLASLTSMAPELTIKTQFLFAAFEYHDFLVKDISKLEEVIKQGKSFEDSHLKTSKFESTFSSVISSYGEREAELKLTLQILIVPILLMLIFYIFMVSQLMIHSETGVISVLESRGAGRRQILLLYGLESLMLGLAALLAGPFLGLWMVQVIGASNGFLEFVSRKALPTRMDGQVVLFGVAAVALIILTTQLPVLLQSRTSIVQQKRKKSRLARLPFWQRFFLDFILIGASLYALDRLNAQVLQQQQSRNRLIGANLDFLLFLASTLFILGVGLLFLRLYPLILSLVYQIGRKIWSPALYASFHRISRSDGQEQFLMIFLILALGLGLFNANAARTINQNTVDSIYCQVGSDIRLQEYWQPYDENGNLIPRSTGSASDLITNLAGKTSSAVKFFEPALERWTNLNGVEHAARVYRSDETRISISGNLGDTVDLMAIDPYDFALTAWSRSGMNSYHLNDYMNVMSSMPNAVIMSSNLRDTLDLKVGDPIIYTINNVDTAEGVIIAFVDYWPGYQPLVMAANGKLTENTLIVANLDYVLSHSASQPYEVWLKRTPNATDKEIYAAIEASGIAVEEIESASQLIAMTKNDPQLQGTNGALTLGFIVSMLICAIGFLIYWIMSIQGRILQFGVFRAMGLGRGPLISMMASEQVLVSGSAIVFGILLGYLSSWLYVPLFQLVYSSADQPVPFQVVAAADDTRKILIILAVLLALCFIVLARLILRIRIAQAVKLGEE